MANYVDEREWPVSATDPGWLEREFARRTDFLARLRRSYETHSHAVDVQDEMWIGLARNMPEHQRPYARKHYMYGGRSAMRAMVTAMIGADVDIPRRILDFPSAHGRVTRFLRPAFPEAEIWCGDVNRAGVDYCVEHFGAKPVYSDYDLSKVAVPGDMNLIWCGSLITHLPEKGCRQVIDLLLNALAPHGILGITTCSRGMAHAQRNIFKCIEDDRFAEIERQVAATGFGYADYSWCRGYGMAFMDPAWIIREVTSREGFSVLGFQEKGWHGTQDVLMVIRRPLSHWYDWEKDN